MKAVDQWTDINPLNDDQAAQEYRCRRIDILIDLMVTPKMRAPRYLRGARRRSR